jgi:hypothetical protein
MYFKGKYSADLQVKKESINQFNNNNASSSYAKNPQRNNKVLILLEI